MDINKEQDFSIPPRMPKIPLHSITYIKVLCYKSLRYVKSIYRIYISYLYLFYYTSMFFTIGGNYMSKSKARELAKKMKVFPPWRHNENYSVKNENSQKKKSFVPIPHTLLMNENFIRLKPSSKIIYIYMTDYANGEEYTIFPKSVYGKITSKQTFASSIKELTKFGFIETVVFGKSTRTENKYRFIDKWKTTKTAEKEKRKTNFNL